MITLKNSQATSTDKPRSLPHVPVLLKEVISGLNIKPDGIYVDLTLGRAGHAKAILEHLPNGLLIGIDRDNEAIKEAPHLRDPLVELALVYYQLEDWEAVIKYCNAALNIPINAKTYINEVFSFDETIDDLLSLAYYNTGNIEKAVELSTEPHMKPVYSKIINKVNQIK